MMSVTRSGLARMSFRSRIVSATSRCSATIFSRSRPVRRWRRMSRMACACFSSSIRVWPSSGAAGGIDARASMGAAEYLPRGSSSDSPRKRSSAALWTRTSDVRRAFASAGSFEDRMIAMTESRLESAIARPTRRWARSSAFWRSKRVLRTTTCRL